MSVEKLTIAVMDDGKFKVKFNMPDIPDTAKREDYLRSIGGVVVQIFSKKMLPGIAKSFENIDEDGRFLCRFIELVLQLKQIADKDVKGTDEPLIRPSQVFQSKGDD